MLYLRIGLAVFIRIGLAVLFLGSGTAPFSVGPALAAPRAISAASPAAATRWVYQTIATGDTPSLAIDPTRGRADVSYDVSGSDDLHAAFQLRTGGNCGTGNAWACGTVDSNGNVGADSSIAVNPLTGLPAIAYDDLTHNNIKFAQYSCNGNLCIWSSSTLDGLNQTLFQPSLRFDVLGKPHIAYARVQPSAALKIASFLGNGAGNCGLNSDWRCDVVESGGAVGNFLSLAVDGSNAPHIAYQEDFSGTLKYAHFVGSGGAGCSGGTLGSTWQCDIIDGAGIGTTHTVGAHVSLYVNPTGSPKPQIAYFDGNLNSLRYASEGGASPNCGPALAWSCIGIGAMGDSPVPSISIAADSAGAPYIAYRNFTDQANSTLKLATPGLFGNCGPLLFGFRTWSCATIDDGHVFLSYHDVGQSPGIALNSAGLLRVVYQDTTNGSVRYAEQQLQTFLPLIAR